MKKLLLIIVPLALLIPAIYRLQPYYQHAIAHRLRSAAEKSFAEQHFDEALRLYRLAIQRDPDDPDTLRSCAAFLDAIHSHDVLQARLRISQLAPNDIPAKLDAIETAIKLRKLNIARRLMENPSPEMQTYPRYYDLLGWMQMLSFNPAEADATWSEALAKNPGNKIYEANLSMVRLSSLDIATREKAFGYLSKIALEEKPPLAALQSLMVYAAQSPAEPPNLDALLERFHTLITPDNPFYTAYLDALHRWRPEPFKKALAAYLEIAATSPGIGMAAMSWLVNARLYDEFLTFQKSLPAPLRESLQCKNWEAEALFNLKRTGELTLLLTKPSWNGILPVKMAWQERMRRAAQPPADPTATGRKWNTILASAGKNDGMLTQLARLSFTWGWQNEYALTLWAISERLPSAAPDAFDNLFHLYARSGDAAALRRVVKKQMALDPANPGVQNNFAFLSFLVGQETSEAEKISASLCAQYPKIPVYISTRAFGYLKQDQPAKGLELFKEIDTAKLQGTAAGVCYGYLLAATGNPAASGYLKDAEKWVSFPQEMELIKTARAQGAALH